MTMANYFRIPLRISCGYQVATMWVFTNIAFAWRLSTVLLWRLFLLLGPRYLFG